MSIAYGHIVNVGKIDCRVIIFGTDIEIDESIENDLNLNYMKF